MSVNKKFVDVLMIKIMPDDECKIKVESLLCDRIYRFIYDMKTIKPGKFPNPRVFHIQNFQVGTSIAVEVQLQAQNFKPQRGNAWLFLQTDRSLPNLRYSNHPIFDTKKKEERKQQVDINATLDQSNGFYIELIAIDYGKKNPQVKQD